MKNGITFLMSLVALFAMAQGEVLHPILEPANNLNQLIEDTSGWDEDYRTSEEEGERGTQFDYDVEHPPSGAVRIGCICMDGTTMDLTGTGACSGYGGVRHWIYRLKDGTERTFPTLRHKEHPSPLSEEDLKNLASRGKLKYGKSYEEAERRFSWEELMAIMIICVTIAFIVHTLWGRKGRGDE